MSDKNTHPIGKFEYGKTYSATETEAHIKIIEALPTIINSIAKDLTPSLLKKSYREGGWNAQQIIHHIADSHSNALIRVKLTLTEDSPVIKPYNQDAWAVLADVENTSIYVSIKMIEAIHARWTAVLKAMTETDLKRKYIHPEYKKEFMLEELIALYSWHGDHHCEQLKVILNNG